MKYKFNYWQNAARLKGGGSLTFYRNNKDLPPLPPSLNLPDY